MKSKSLLTTAVIYDTIITHNLSNQDKALAISNLLKILDNYGHNNYARHNKIVESLNELEKQKFLHFENNNLVVDTEYEKAEVVFCKNHSGIIKDKNGVAHNVKNIGTAMIGDEVLFAPLTNGVGIVQILKRKTTRVSGYVRRSTSTLANMNGLEFVPDDKELKGRVVFKTDKSIDLEKILDKKILVNLSEVVDYNDKNILVSLAYDTDVAGNEQPCIYGNIDNMSAQSNSIAAAHGISSLFSMGTIDEMKSLPTEVGILDRKNIKDFVDVPFVTIDPHNCRDMDDAVYVEKTADGYVAYVAIADVSHYVNPKKNPSTFADAMVKGNSCYMPTMVFPMLPVELSNGICSLNPDVLRRATVLRAELSNDGAVIDFSLQKGVIKSRAKLHYEQVQDLYDGKSHLNNITDADKIEKMIPAAYELSRVLTTVRNDRQALRLESSEQDFTYNHDTHTVENIQEHTTAESTSVIESMMILYNEIVGFVATKNNLVLPYRVHDQPNENIVDLINFAESLNIEWNQDISKEGLNRLIDAVKDKYLKNIVSNKELRYMAKAIYQVDNIGHYGLGVENKFSDVIDDPAILGHAYVHSTSPIRRFADLVTHMVLEEVMSRTPENKITKNSAVELEYNDYIDMGMSSDMIEAACYDISKREQDAEQAERQADVMGSVLWANEHKGETFEGVIYELFRDYAIVKLKSQLVGVKVYYADMTTNKRFGKPNIAMTEIRVGNSVHKLGDSYSVTIGSADLATLSIVAESVSTEPSIIRERDGLKDVSTSIPTVAPKEKVAAEKEHVHTKTRQRYINVMAR